MIKAVIFDFNGVIYGEDYDRRILEFIRQLRSKYLIGMITNFGPGGYERYVLPVKDMFDDIVVSSQVGLAKPQTEIYQLAAERLQLKPRECVYIDDEEYRVDGAKRAGMHAIGYYSFAQMKKELGPFLAPVADD